MAGTALGANAANANLALDDLADDVLAPWEPLAQFAAVIPASTSSGVYLMRRGNGLTTPQGTTTVAATDYIVYFNSARIPGGSSRRLIARARFGITCNAVAPGVGINFSLYVPTFTFPASGATSFPYISGVGAGVEVIPTIVASSTIAATTPLMDVNTPTYLEAVVYIPSGTTAADSHLSVLATIEYNSAP